MQFKRNLEEVGSEELAVLNAPCREAEAKCALLALKTLNNVQKNKNCEIVQGLLNESNILNQTQK